MPTHITPAPALMVERWVPQIREAANRYTLDPYLVAAVVAHESGGPHVLPDGSCNPYAIRPEPRFWMKYLAGITMWVKNSPQKYDDHWSRFPDVYSTSYGLMQVLYQTALEHGFVGKFPTELCDPKVGLDMGCRILKRHYDRTGGNTRQALLCYNGGGDPAYPDKIQDHLRVIAAERVFGRVNP